MNHPTRVEIYDTTLRDGTQGEGVAFSLIDKLKITEHLDALGIDYIEGGYPLSNPKDQAFFQEARKLKLRHAKVCAFGMTRRKGMAAGDDPGMRALVEAGAPVVTIVGKTWDLHVDEVLRISRQENLDMIRESLAFVQSQGPEVFYDAEHFFDGYRANPEYALATLRAAVEGGATRLVLCDTNGGSLPEFVGRVVGEVRQALGGGAGSDALRSAAKGGDDHAGIAPPPATPTTPNPQPPTPLLGIHVHNDGGLAVANSVAAVQAGALQVQGTMNGIGERCGNVDLTTIIAHLLLKTEGRFTCLADPANLSRLTETSRYIYEMANMNFVTNQPYVGVSAFAHKGGMHVHAVQRVAHSYEHVAPDRVGNTRRILVSELSGASNVVATLGKKFNIEADKAVQRRVLERVQDLEHQGFQFESATASFELLVHEAMGTRPQFWKLNHYRCVISKSDGDAPVTEASVKLTINGTTEHRVAEGDGPVNALDGALRRCLEPHYPQLAKIHLRDYRVRVVNATAESAAKVRVTIEFSVGDDNPTDGTPGAYFATVGVSENIVDASWQALADAFAYRLIETTGR